MIEAYNLVKKFGDFCAVDELTLSIKDGECFGLLGPNGAGKSTFINMVYGASLKTAGELKVFNMDPKMQGREIKKRLGVVTQDNALDESLTVKENMLIYAAYLNVPFEERESRVSELLKYMNLDHKANAPIRALSGGMKRRLVFVRALMGNPQIIILDEPTTGLDPAVRHLLWGKVKELRSLGKTIVLTTHYMHEAEILCDRVAIMNRGNILDIGSPQDLISKYVPGFVAVYEKSDENLKILSKENISSDHSGIYLRRPHLEDILDFNKSKGLNPLQIRPSNLEDVFLTLTGQELMIND